MPMLDYLTGSHYYGIIQYKQRKKEINKEAGNNNRELFYRFINGVGYIPAHGEKVGYNGITGYLFTSKETGTVIIEAKSGCVVARKGESKDIIFIFKSVIDSNGIDKINSLIDGLIKKNGISPLFGQSELVSV